MKHYLYCSSGNTVGLNEYLGFFEIDEDGYCIRYLETRSDGRALRYTEQNPAGEFGVLPEKHRMSKQWQSQNWAFWSTFPNGFLIVHGMPLTAATTELQIDQLRSAVPSPTTEAGQKQTSPDRQVLAVLNLIWRTYVHSQTWTAPL